MNYARSVMPIPILYDCPKPCRFWPEDESCRKLMEITKSAKLKPLPGYMNYLQKTYYTRDNLEDDYNAHKERTGRIQVAGALKALLSPSDEPGH